LSEGIKLIVGLGNPGSQHLGDRHNVGFWFTDLIANDYHSTFKTESKYKGEIANTKINSHDCKLLKPSTFMNTSGTSVAPLVNFFKLKSENILVVHDELDLAPGEVRLKFQGGHGGHNGLRDIISRLGSKNFYRLRIGIGHPGHKDAVSGYVLTKPSATDRTLINNSIEDAMRVLPEIIAGEFNSAMKKLHTK